MKSTTKVSLILAMIVSSLAFTACSSPSSESSDTTATDAAAPAAADKLDAEFVTIATGGASGPYNIIGTSLAEIYAKPLTSTQRLKPQAPQ